VDLRGEVLACVLNERKEPQVEVSAHQTPTLAEKAAAEAALASAANEDTAEAAPAEPAAGTAV
jgi:hypothetical protein